MFKPDDKVRLKLGVSSKRGRRAIATIERKLEKLYAGGMVLDRPLDGNKFWNKSDLEKVEAVDG